MTSSVESQYAAPGYLPYSASKWALMALQEEWYSSHESTGHQTNIDFVSILPGTVNTSLGYTASYGMHHEVPAAAMHTWEPFCSTLKSTCQ